MHHVDEAETLNQKETVARKTTYTMQNH